MKNVDKCSFMQEVADCKKMFFFEIDEEYYPINFDFEKNEMWTYGLIQKIDYDFDLDANIQSFYEKLIEDVALWI